MNLFLMLGAAGLSHEFFGERLFPIGTVYDPFISRGLDAMNYACYQDARFMIVTLEVDHWSKWHLQSFVKLILIPI